VLEISAPDGRIREGTYTLFSCPPGELTDNGLVIGTLPAGSSTPEIIVDNDAGTVCLAFPPTVTLILLR
jgi:hypothetical protein